MQDTPAFLGLSLLRQLGVRRPQALRLGPPELVRQVANMAIDKTLHAASAEAVPVMIFVASRALVAGEHGR
jgi:putative hemin transport protein